MSTFNNEVTYADWWDTSSNQEAHSKLEKKFFPRSHCSPSCPVGWAPEVLDLLETLDREFGIERNTETINGHYVRNVFSNIFVEPFIAMIYRFHYNFMSPLDMTNDYLREHRDTPITVRLLEVIESGIHSFQYGLKAFNTVYVNDLLNKLHKPKIRIDQLKEKYGRLEIYYSTPPYLTDYIDQLIRKCKVKLSMKGCYYPIESLYEARSTWICGTENSPEVFSVEERTHDDVKYTYVSKTIYREAMQELGIDLKEIEKRSELIKKVKQ